tara:strand:+ start:1841 stop:2101 length:261 start_codon:yes stop_codon:yes gene_type:complete
MSDYTITLTSAQEKALETEMIDINEWIKNAIFSRAEIASSDIVRKLLDHCNANDIALATGLAAQIDQAYDLGIAEKVSESSPPAVE